MFVSGHMATVNGQLGPTFGGIKRAKPTVTTMKDDGSAGNENVNFHVTSLNCSPNIMFGYQMPSCPASTVPLQMTHAHVNGNASNINANKCNATIVVPNPNPNYMNLRTCAQVAPARKKLKSNGDSGHSNSNNGHQLEQQLFYNPAPLMLLPFLTVQQHFQPLQQQTLQQQLQQVQQFQTLQQQHQHQTLAQQQVELVKREESMRINKETKKADVKSNEDVNINIDSKEKDQKMLHLAGACMQSFFSTGRVYPFQNVANIYASARNIANFSVKEVEELERVFKKSLADKSFRSFCIRWDHQLYSDQSSPDKAKLEYLMENIENNSMSDGDWTVKEDTLVVAAAVEVFLERGFVCSFSEKNDVCYPDIKAVFDLLGAYVNHRSSATLQTRNCCTISKRYHMLTVRSSSRTGESLENYYKVWRLWARRRGIPKLVHLDSVLSSNNNVLYCENNNELLSTLPKTTSRENSGSKNGANVVAVKEKNSTTGGGMDFLMQGIAVREALDRNIKKPLSTRSSAKSIPKKKKAKSTRQHRAAQKTTTNTTANGKTVALKMAKQTRTKWTHVDLITMWDSISKYGNEWQKVKQTLNHRSYHQVKDKGKRLLHEQGWETGRTKASNDKACEAAKRIGSRMSKKVRLAQKPKKNDNLLNDDAEAVSNGYESNGDDGTDVSNK